MRSIRHSIPSSSRVTNITFSRHISKVSSVATAPLCHVPLSSRKGKEKAIDSGSKVLKESSGSEAQSGRKTRSACAPSEFEAITRLYDTAECQPLATERVAPRGTRKTLIRRFGDFQQHSRLPPVPSCTWKTDGRQVGGKGSSKSIRIGVAHTPIPLTFGSGAVDRRVKRYQQTIKQRERDFRAVVDALKGPDDMLGRRFSDEMDGGTTSPRRRWSPSTTKKAPTSSPWSRHHSPSSVSPGSVLLARHFSRTYGTSADTIESTDPQERSIPSAYSHAPMGDPTRHVGTDPRRGLDNISILDSEASNKNKSHLAVKLSTWPAEEWKSGWGVDQLAPPNSHHVSNLPPSNSNAPPAAVLQQKKPKPRPRVSRTIKARPAIVPSKSGLSRRLAKLQQESRENAATTDNTVPIEHLFRYLRGIISDEGGTAPAEDLERSTPYPEHRLRDEEDSSQIVINGTSGTRMAHDTNSPFQRSLIKRLRMLLDPEYSSMQSESIDTEDKAHTTSGAPQRYIKDPAPRTDPLKDRYEDEIKVFEGGSENPPQSTRAPPKIQMAHNTNSPSPQNLVEQLHMCLSPGYSSMQSESVDTEKDKAHTTTGVPQHHLEDLAPTTDPLEDRYEDKPKVPEGGSENRPQSTQARKKKEMALMAKAKQEFLATILSKRKEKRVTRRPKKAAPRGASIKGVLKPLPSNAEVLEDIIPPYEPRAIPRLAHGLDRVLFNPSVHWVQDPHSRVYNFSPSLQSLPPVTEFAFERLGPYVSSSRDESLHALALKHSKRFAGSTSSLTGFMSHIYFLISGNRLVDISTLSMAFQKESRTFTPGMRMPAGVVLRHRRSQVGENGQPTLTENPESSLYHSLSPGGQSNSPTQSATQNNITDSTDSPSVAVEETSHKDMLTASARSPDGETTGGPDHSASDQSEAQTDVTPLSDNLRNETSPDGRIGPLTIPSGPANLSSNALRPDDTIPVDALYVALTTGGSEQPRLPSTSQNVSEACEVSVGGLNSSRMFDTYAIDGGSDDPEERRLDELNVLLWLGTMAEKFLTLPEPEFTALLRKSPVNESLVEHKRAESYRYAKSSQFVMRSQLDCQDTRLPGTGVFDIKTRAVLPIRMDHYNYLNNAGYLIRRMTGLLESFEREYYDLIRSAFLKYTFQARIGNMDGVFVAYHNTARMFGFQYVPLTEMEERLYGPGPPGRGAKIFEKCVGLLEVICNEAVACFPGESVGCTIEAKDDGILKVWVWPISKPDSKSIAELSVTVHHTVQGLPANNTIAINRANDDWVLHYRIARSPSSESEIWATHEEVKRRQFSSALPEGVSAAEMDERLALVNFGAGKGFDQELPEGLEREDSNGPAGKSRFKQADKRLNFLRNLAKKGWADIQRENDSTAQQVVFGVDGEGSILRGADKEPTQPSTAGSFPDDANLRDQSERVAEDDVSTTADEKVE